VAERDYTQLNPGQKLLIVVLGERNPDFVIQASHEVAVWEFIDAVLSEREAFVLKHRFGQVGRSHNLTEVGRMLPRAQGGGIGVTSEMVRRIEAKALRKLRHPRNSSWLRHIWQGGPPEPPPNSSQRLLREVFGYDYDNLWYGYRPKPNVDDHAVDEAAVWQLIDEVLSEKEALVLKYRFGQVGECHSYCEVARILPRAKGGGIGVTGGAVRSLEQRALGKLEWPATRARLRFLAERKPSAPARPLSSEECDLPLERLGLSRRVFNCLRRNNITNLGDLQGMTERGLMAISKFGTKSLEDLKYHLEGRGLALPLDTRLRYLAEGNPSAATSAVSKDLFDSRSILKELMRLEASRGDIEAFRRAVNQFMSDIPESEPDFHASHDTQAQSLLCDMVEIASELVTVNPECALELTERALKLEPWLPTATKLQSLRVRLLTEIGRPLPPTRPFEEFRIRLGHDYHDCIVPAGDCYVGTHYGLEFCPDSTRVLIQKGRLQPRVFLHDVVSNKMVWELTLSGNPSRVYYVPGGTLLVQWTQWATPENSPTHRCTERLQFIDSSGLVSNEHMFHKRLNKVVVSSRGVLVGCDDGCLHAYDRTGALSWRFKLPSEEAKLVAGRRDSFQASEQWEGILVSFSKGVYLLDAHGRPRAEWHTVGRDYIHTVAASSDGQGYVVATYRHTHVLNKDLVTVFSCPPGDAHRSIALLDRGSTLMLRETESLDFYKNPREFKRLALPMNLAQSFTVHSSDRYILCWGEDLLSVVSCDAERVVECQLSLAPPLKKVGFCGSLLAVDRGDRLNLFHLKLP